MGKLATQSEYFVFRFDTDLKRDRALVRNGLVRAQEWYPELQEIGIYKTGPRYTVPITVKAS